MKKIIYFLLFVTLSINSKAQNYHEIKIGDKVPEITIKGFYDDDKKSVKLSELYQHKLLILDFWGTWCGSCLDEMMTFPKLKEQFGDKLNIVAVGYETKERIAGLFKRNAFFHNKNWTTLYGDTLLTKQLFPHHTLPHLVWIDSTGRVVTITSGDYLTKSYIADFFEGKKINAREKIDNDNYSLEVLDKPFRQMDTNFIARSIFTHQMTGGGLSFTTVSPAVQDKNPLFYRSYVGNISLWDIYYRAVFPIDANTLNKSRLIFEVSDSLRWTDPKFAPQSFKNSKYKTHDEWADSNLYCYDLVLPKKVSESIIRAYMLTDINRALNFNGRWEKREMECYAIQNDDKKSDELLTINPIEGKDVVYKAETIENITSDQFAELLNKRIITGYVFNESTTGGKLLFDFNVNIHQNIKPQEIAFLLKKVGLRYVKVKRMVPVYVVSEY